MRLRPTALGAKGALFFAIVLLLLLATPYSNLFFLLTAFLGVLAAIGVASAIANVRGLEATLLRLDQAPAGGMHGLSIRLVSPRGRPVFGVTLALASEGELLTVGRAPLVRGTAIVDGELTVADRGVRPAAAIVLRSRHPLGICAVERRLPLTDVAIVTYPRPLGAGQGDPGGAHDSDVLALARKAGETTVAGLREWRPGDSLREIHWRATARRGEPVVKEREHDGGAGLDVVVDRRGSAAGLEHALAAATAVVLDAGERKQALQLRSQGFACSHTADQPAITAMLRWLAAASPLPVDAAPPPTSAPTAIVLAAGGGA